jgi:hypothetical protein
MRLRDAVFLNTTEEGKFLQSRLLAWGLVNEALPCVPPWVTYAELRRLVARLRSGKMRGDPRIPPDAFADFIEASMEQDIMVHSVTMAALEQTEIERELEQRNEAKRAKRFVASFHRLKKSPEARDPDSKVAEKVRRIHRQRRRELGRPGKTGGGEKS